MGKKLSSDELLKLPKTQAEALESGQRYFFTGKPCKNGHISQRVIDIKKQGAKNECFECRSLRNKNQRASNREATEAFNAERRSPVFKKKENARRREKYRSDKKYKDRIKSQQFKRRYGIDLSEYQSLLKKQNDLCAICKVNIGKSRYKRDLAVDHDHRLGTVRGLLCTNCNTMLGYLQDDPKRCIKAASYLEKSGDYRDAAYLKRKARGRRQAS